MCFVACPHVYAHPLHVDKVSYYCLQVTSFFFFFGFILENKKFSKWILKTAAMKKKQWRLLSRLSILDDEAFQRACRIE